MTFRRTLFISMLALVILSIAAGTAQGSRRPFEPERWNADGTTPMEREETRKTQLKNNCYNYACMKKAGTEGTGEKSQPGRAASLGDLDFRPSNKNFNCEEFTRRLKADGLNPIDCDMECPPASHKVQLFLGGSSLGGRPLRNDFHFYKQDLNGKWSHKPGQTEAKNKDESGNEIADPNDADKLVVRLTLRGLLFILDYPTDCFCFCCDSRKVKFLK